MERLAAYWDKQAGRYDRQMDRWDRRLSLLLVDHVAASARALRAAQWLYERISIPLAGEHFLRRPLVHVRELGFAIEETQRLKLGIVERICARKPKLAPLRSSVP